MKRSLAFVILMLACGPAESGEPAPESEPGVSGSSGLLVLPEENGGEPDPPLREEEEGTADDVPERAQLEARCFSGDHAACDELGH